MDTQTREFVNALGRLLENSILFVLPFFVCLAVIQLLIRLAPRFGMLDLPNERKLHDGATPLVGGVAIFFATMLSLGLLALSVSNLLLMLLAFLLVVLGLLDDRLDLSVVSRVVVQVATTLTMIATAGLNITDLGNLFGTGPVVLGSTLGVIATVVFTLGVINAINMVDGVDGLAGTLLLISFLILAFLAAGAGEFSIGKALFICAGTLAAFLCFNARLFVRRAEVFMGDAGSMMLGFILLWFFARMTQDPIAILSPVSAGWVFGVPLLDTTVVIARRLRARRSPLSAGRDHLHHALLDAGLSVNRTVICLALLHATMGFVGIWLNGHRAYEPVLFFGFVALFATDFLARERIVGGIARHLR